LGGWISFSTSPSIRLEKPGCRSTGDEPSGDVLCVDLLLEDVACRFVPSVGLIFILELGISP